MKQLILFSQAPADIVYVLSLYEQKKEQYKIKIIVVNVMNNFKFLSSLKLKAEIEYIPVVGKRKIFKMLFFFVYLRIIYLKLFNKIERSEVYFFSDIADYVTAFFIERLSFKHKVFYIDIKKVKEPEIHSFKNNLSKFAVQFILGIRINFFIFHTGGKSYQYLFDHSRVIEKTLNPDDKVLNQYQYHVNSLVKNKKILFFEANSVLQNYYVNYEKMFRLCIEHLSKKYTIYIKPHPRVGYSSFLNDCKVEIIESYIPSEFIFLKDFDIILGVETTAVATAKHHNKYSIIDIFEFNDKNVKIKFKEYMDEVSKGSLLYISDIKKI
jgi:hypothetical protein